MTNSVFTGKNMAKSEQLPPGSSLPSKINNLTLYNGQGITCLLESDGKKGMLLLERLRLCTMLVTLIFSLPDAAGW